MEPCTNPELGGLLPFYELKALSEDDMNAFEAHLLDCEFCLYELAASHDTTRLVVRNAEALRTHYEEVGNGFAEEIASLSKGASNNSGRSRFATGAGFLARWLTERIPRAAIVPAAAVVALGFMFVLRQAPNPRVTSRVESETQTPVENGKQPPDPNAATPKQEVSTYTLKSDPTPQAEPETKGQELPIDDAQSNAAAKTPIEISAELSALLPVSAITYTGMITRGSSAVSEPLSMTGDPAQMVQHGMDMYTAGDYVASAAILSRAVLNSPHDSRTLTYLGSSLYMNRDYDGAADALKRAQFYAGDSADPQVLLYRASSLIRIGRFNEADSILADLLNSPDHTIAQQTEKILNRIKIEKK